MPAPLTASAHYFTPEAMLTAEIPQANADADDFRAHLATYDSLVTLRSERAIGSHLTVFVLDYEVGADLWIVAAAWGMCSTY